MRFFTRRWYEYALSLLIPLAVLLFGFYANGVYPFGDTSVMIWDMDIQYAGYFGWLCNVMHGVASPLYSFSQGLGDNTLALVSYYLASPFNLLVVFFTPATIPQFFSVLTLVKLPFAGLTCYVFLRKRYNPGTMNLVLSCAYALCGFVIFECSNIMWMDGVIMLPIIALGTCRAVEERRYALLYLSIALTIVFEWYTGYMDCLFSVLLFLFLELKLGGFSFRGRGRAFFMSGLRYLATMLLAIGTSMVLFLPAIFGLMRGKGGGLSLGDIFSIWGSFNPADFFDCFVITAGPHGSEVISPAIYVSAVVIILVAAFFLDDRIEKRYRIAMFVFLILIAAGFFSRSAEVIWSCFKRSTSYYYRFSFVFDFLLVVIAQAGYRSLVDADRRHRVRLLSTSTVVIIVLMLVSIVNLRFYTKQITPSAMAIAVEFALLVVFTVLIVFTGRRIGTPRRSGRALARGETPEVLSCGKTPEALAAEDGTSEVKAHDGLRKVALAIIVVVFVAEQCYNVRSVFAHYSSSVSTYESYIDKMLDVYADLKTDEGSTTVGQAWFSSMSDGPFYTTGEGMVYGAQGFNDYSSTMDSRTETLITSLGYSMKSEIFGTRYNSPMLVPDSLLSVDYIISHSKPAGTTEVATSELPYDGFAAYSNDEAMPFGYGIAKGAGTVGWTDDPFKNHEIMLADMLGSDSVSLYTDDPWTDVTGSAEAFGTRTLDVTISQTGPAYFYSPVIESGTDDEFIETTVYVNDVPVQFIGGRFSGNVVYLGDFNEGDVVSVKLVVMYPDDKLQEKGVFGGRTKGDVVAGLTADDIEIVSLDVPKFDGLKSQLDSSGLAVDTFEDGYVSLEFDADADETLLLCIPYGNGWSAQVDGVDTKIEQCYTGLIGVPVSAGRHTVTLRYTNPGFIPGIAISAICILIFILWRRLARRRAGHLEATDEDAPVASAADETGTEVDAD